MQKKCSGDRAGRMSGKAKIPGGYYIKARKIQESVIAHAPPRIREIFDLLIRKANHKTVRYNGTTIKRGQLFTTYKDIIEELKWYVGFCVKRYNESQVKRAMSFLRKHQAITTRKTTRGVGSFFETTSDKASSSGQSNGYSPEFAQFWELQIKKVGKGEAYRAWQKIKGDKTHIMEEWKKQKPRYEARRNEGDTEPPYPATWLKESRWDDDPDAIHQMKDKWND
jgi:hypothetical protein